MLVKRKRKATAEKHVDYDLLQSALAKAICAGDIVNFRLLFSSFSPGRTKSTEHLESDKYAYLLPDEDMENAATYRTALEAVRGEAVWAHVMRELGADRPAQLPAELVLLLADNAVRLGKYTAASQAYEMLRIRRRMQSEFLNAADEALKRGDIQGAVRGYRIGSGLSYDYAAFPEPLPLVPNYQTKALILHGTYPDRPENCLALYDPERHVRAALDYLLYNAEIAARLQPISLDVRLGFLKELVQQIDPGWDTFVDRYREACELVAEYGRPSDKSPAESNGALTLEEEIDRQRREDPRRISAALLGRMIEGGEWWQYLKELAYEHPAAILFVARQVVGDHEIIMPRYRTASQVPKMLGLPQLPAIEGEGAKERAVSDDAS